jgi:hypothetical protein
VKKQINIRAHHIPCISRFYRGGYNKTFADNMRRICRSVRNNPFGKIKVVVGKLDDICMKCPYNFKEKCIQSKEIGKRVVSQDKKVAKYLSLKHNSVHAAKELFNLSMKKINKKTIRPVCKNCILLDNCIKVGINNSFKRDLNS